MPRQTEGYFYTNNEERCVSVVSAVCYRPITQIISPCFYCWVPEVQHVLFCKFKHSVGQRLFSSLDSTLRQCNWLKQVAVLHSSFVSPSLPAVIDSQPKIQSKPGPHVWCHLSNLTNPVVKAERTGLLMPTYLQPINIYLIPALEIARRCYSRSVSSSSPLLSFHPLHISLFHSFTLFLAYCFTLLQCWPLTAARTQLVQWCKAAAWCNTGEHTTNGVNVLSTFLFFI